MFERTRLRVEEIGTRNRWAEIEGEWDRLLERVERPSPFLTSDWLRIVWQHFGKGARLFLLALWDADELVGLVPLKICREGRLGFRQKVIRFIGEPFSDFSDFILARNDRESFAAILKFLLEERRKWDRFCLREIPPTSNVLSVFSELLSECRGAPNPEIHADSSCFVIPIRTDWESFYRLSFRSKRRREHRVARDRSGVTFRIVRDLDDEPDILDRCRALALANPVYRGRGGLLVGGARADFFHEVCRAFSKKGWLNIGLLERRGKVEAFVVGFECAGRYFSYDTTYDQNLPALNLGTTLFLEVMQDCFRRRLREFHMLRGRTPLKEKLHLEMFQNCQIHWSWALPVLPQVLF